MKIKTYIASLTIAIMAITSCTKNENKLTVIDDFSKDSRNSYITNTKTGNFDLTENNWRIQDGKFYTAPIDRENQWNNNPKTKKGANVYRKNEKMKPGEAIAVTIGYTDKAWKYPRYGLVIENTTFTINPGNAGFYITINGKDYDLKVKQLEGENVTLTLVRGTGDNSKTINWYAIGGGISKRGEYIIPKLSDEAYFGLSFSNGYREEQRDYYLTNFCYGSINTKELNSTPIAELTMKSKLPVPKSNKTVPLLESRDGKLTAKELDKLVEWAINEPGQWSNHGNRALSGHRSLYRVYKVYDKTKDIRILNHLVDIAEMALASRNDNNEVIGHLKTLTGYKDGKWTYDIGPSWPHFMGWNEQDGDRLYHGDAGEDAVGVHYLSLAARAIAETPEIWSKKAKDSDKTYLELAKKYTKEGIYTVENSIIPKFIEPNTLESIYQYRRSEPGASTLDLGGYVPFNRFWHVPIAFVSLCPAMEILKIETEKVATYDKIVNVSINRWIKSMELYKKDGLDLIDYPYCYPSAKEYAKDTSKWSFMPTKFKGFPSEDLNHLGCDASQLYIFHFSPRYNVPKDILQKYANTLVVNTPQKDSEYLAYRLNGSGKGKTKTLSVDAYFFTLFQPKLIPFYWDNEFQDIKAVEWETLFFKVND